jgi:hypothetical protein
VSSENEWITMEIDEGDEFKASNLVVKSLGKFYNRFKERDEIRKQRMFIGYIGAIKFNQFLNLKNIRHDVHWFNEDGSPDTFDFRINDKTIDIKTLKRTVNPQEYYRADVIGGEHGEHGRICNYYCFISFNLTTKKVFLLGGISYNEFYKFANFRKKGSFLDSLGLIKENKYDVQISELESIENIINKIHPTTNFRATTLNNFMI